MAIFAILHPSWTRPAWIKSAQHVRSSSGSSPHSCITRPPPRMPYNNPLHPAVAPEQRSAYTTLGHATSCAQETSHFLSPTTRRLPQAPWTPSCKWKLATGRTNVVHSAIPFDFHGYTRQGVPMHELSSRSSSALVAMIQGGDDQVLAHIGLTRIFLHILWPGYEHVKWVRRIEVNSHGPITRARLGAVVSQHFARYVEATRPEQSRCPEWHLGIRGIRFEQLILLSLKNVFGDVWQADVAVDFRC